MSNSKAGSYNNMVKTGVGNNPVCARSDIQYPNDMKRADTLIYRICRICRRIANSHYARLINPNAACHHAWSAFPAVH